MLNNLTSDFYHIPYISSHTPNIAYLSFPFHLGMVGHLCANEGYCLEQEGFDQYFFGLTLSGTGTLEFRDSKFNLTANKAFLLNRNEYFKIGTCKGFKWDFKWFYFNGTACNDYFQLINGKSFQSVPLADTIEVSKLIDELQILTKIQNPMVDLEISMIITKILTGVIKSKYLNTNITPDKFEILKKSMDYILNNYSNNIKISDICNAAFTSKSHLIKLFNMHMHTTPHKYITKLRIDKSKKLLSETQAPIDDISQQAGFETTGLFIDNFKKYTGMTPSRFRKAIMSPSESPTK